MARLFVFTCCCVLAWTICSAEDAPGDAGAPVEMSEPKVPAFPAWMNPGPGGSAWKHHKPGGNEIASDAEDKTPALAWKPVAEKKPSSADGNDDQSGDIYARIANAKGLSSEEKFLLSLLCTVRKHPRLIDHALDHIIAKLNLQNSDLLESLRETLTIGGEYYGEEEEEETAEASDGPDTDDAQVPEEAKTTRMTTAQPTTSEKPDGDEGQTEEDSSDEAGEVQEKGFERQNMKAKIMKFLQTMRDKEAKAEAKSS